MLRRLKTPRAGRETALNHAQIAPLRFDQSALGCIKSGVYALNPTRFRQFAPQKEPKQEMANHFSALKRARQTVKRTQVNRVNRSRLRTALRGLREAIAAGDRKAAESSLSATTSVIDKAIQKGVIHKNTASRYKSRLSVRVKAVAAK